MSGKRVRLSDAQRRAVEHWGGSVMVLAGPGAGKTEVLVERAVHVIDETPRRRFRVLGLTFTSVAAGEMRARIGLRLGWRADRTLTRTFHSFCADILRLHGSHLGLRPDFTILPQPADRALVLAEALGTRAPWGPGPAPAEQIARKLDYLFRQDPRGGEAVRAHGDGGWGRWVLTPYIDRLVQRNCMDFGSLLLCCLQLMKRFPDLLDDYPVAYPHVLVDEYQDTNAIQDRLLRTLWPPGTANLFVVADDDQMIYQWNGASPERISRLRDDYGMEVLRLPESYRCPPRILRTADGLIRAAPDSAARFRQRPPLEARDGPARYGDIRVHRDLQNELHEARWVAQHVACRRIASERCAVLARTTHLVAGAWRALRNKGIPAWRREQQDGFVSSEVRFLLAALRLANSPSDGAQLRLLAKSFRELTGVEIDVDGVEEIAELENGALLAAFTEIARDQSTSRLSTRLIGLVRRHLVMRSEHRLFDQGALDLLAGSESTGEPSGAPRELETWRSIARGVRQNVGRDVTLSQFLHEVDLRAIVPEPTPDQVRCLTIHQAKGKTFRHVYLIGLAEGVLPTTHAIRRGPASAEIEEERRNCYVAITRASGTLTLSCARNYYGVPRDPSRFLNDMEVGSTKA